MAERSEDGLALEFVRQHRHRLRFDHTSQRWHVWDGTRWKLDGTNQAFDWARSVTREFRYSQENDLLQLAKMAVAAAVERGARADQQVAVTHEAWDSDRWRLGTQEDEIDLTTGDTNRPMPRHMITRSAQVCAVARMPAPLWDGFMWDTFGGDIDLIDFMHRWFGYCLSGDVSAEMFAFLYGTGGNGKGVLVHTVSTIAGEYALRVPAEMFMQRRFAEHPTEIAQLMGRRMVIASEVPDGAAFNLSRIKELTGNEGTLSARFMRGNYFEFKPTHKITLVGNHKPRLDHADEAFRRRLILVPFTHTPAVPDPTLKERLVPEYPAILRRLIDGCAEVYDTLVNQKKPFRSLVPAAVSAASQSYLVEQDVVAAWLTECCEYDVTARSLTVKPAFLAHTVWCQDEGRTVTAVERTFGEEVVRASGTLGWDLRVQHGMKGKIIQGLRLRA